MHLPVVKRYYERCYIGNGGYQYCYTSAWNSWVRWVVLAAIVVCFFLLFVACSCITARRRRKAGRQPFYGTGWAHRPGQNNQPYYNDQYAAQSAPPYTAKPTQGYYSGQTAQPYYGQQEQGVELQSPAPAHHAATTYAPPPGPPPTEKDGVIR